MDDELPRFERMQPAAASPEQLSSSQLPPLPPGAVCRSGSSTPRANHGPSANHNPPSTMAAAANRRKSVTFIESNFCRNETPSDSGVFSRHSSTSSLVQFQGSTTSASRRMSGARRNTLTSSGSTVVIAGGLRRVMCATRNSQPQSQGSATATVAAVDEPAARLRRPSGVRTFSLSASNSMRVAGTATGDVRESSLPLPMGGDQGHHHPPVSSSYEEAVMGDGGGAGTPNGGEDVEVLEAVITEAEYRNMKRMFDEYDDNKNGSIEIGELQRLLQHAGMALDNADIAALIVEVTEESDRKELYFSDFVKFVLFWKNAARFRLLDLVGSMTEDHISHALSTTALLSDSTWRFFWDCALLVCTVFIICITGYLYTRYPYADRVPDPVGSPMGSGFLAAECVASIVMAIDVVIAANTAVLDGRHLVESRSSIAAHYAKTFMIPDVLAVLPLWLFVPTTAVPYVLPLRLPKALKMMWLWETSGRVALDPTYVLLFFQIKPIIHGIAGFAVLVHSAAMIAMYTNSHVSYSAAIYYAMYTISGVGYGDTPETLATINQQWFTMVLMGFSMLINGIVVGGLVSYFSVSDVAQERRSKLRETAALCDFFEIPTPLANEVLQFQDHVLRNNLGTVYYALIANLPNDMRLHIGIFSRMKLIERHPLFSTAHRGVLVSLAQLLESVICVPEEYVVIADSEAAEMFFVAHGFLDVYSRRGVYKDTIKTGDHFGEAVLFTARRHVVSVKALSYCDLFVLTRERFATVASRFQNFRAQVTKELENFTKPRATMVLAAISAKRGTAKQRKGSASTTTDSAGGGSQGGDPQLAVNGSSNSLFSVNNGVPNTRSANRSNDGSAENKSLSPPPPPNVPLAHLGDDIPRIESVSDLHTLVRPPSKITEVPPFVHQQRRMSLAPAGANRRRSIALIIDDLEAEEEGAFESLPEPSRLAARDLLLFGDDADSESGDDASRSDEERAKHSPTSPALPAPSLSTASCAEAANENPLASPPVPSPPHPHEPPSGSSSSSADALSGGGGTTVTMLMRHHSHTHAPSTTADHPPPLAQHQQQQHALRTFSNSSMLSGAGSSSASRHARLRASGTLPTVLTFRGDENAAALRGDGRLLSVVSIDAGLEAEHGAPPPQSDTTMPFLSVTSAEPPAAIADDLQPGPSVGSAAFSAIYTGVFTPSTSLAVPGQTPRSTRRSQLRGLRANDTDTMTVLMTPRSHLMVEATPTKRLSNRSMAFLSEGSAPLFEGAPIRSRGHSNAQEIVVTHPPQAPSGGALLHPRELVQRSSFFDDLPAPPPARLGTTTPSPPPGFSLSAPHRDSTSITTQSSSQFDDSSVVLAASTNSDWRPSGGGGGGGALGSTQVQPHQSSARGGVPGAPHNTPAAPPFSFARSFSPTADSPVDMSNTTMPPALVAGYAPSSETNSTPATAAPSAEGDLLMAQLEEEMRELGDLLGELELRQLERSAVRAESASREPREPRRNVAFSHTVQ